MIKKNSAFKRLVIAQNNSESVDSGLKSLLALKKDKQKKDEESKKTGVRIFYYQKSSEFSEDELETGLYYRSAENLTENNFIELNNADQTLNPGTAYYIDSDVPAEHLDQALTIFNAASSLHTTDNSTSNTSSVSLQKEPKQTSSWRTMAQSIGFGDAAWSASSMIMVKAGASVTATTVMSCLFPFTLGIFVGYLDYCSQVQRYRELNNGKDPSDKLKDEYFKNSLALTFKMAAAVGGWTFGYEIMAPAFEEGVKSILKFMCGSGAFLDGGVTHVSAALAVGLGAALFLVTTAIIADIGRQLIENPNKTKTQAFLDVAWKDMAKLFVCSFFAGIIWYGISILPFNGALQALGFDGIMKEIFKVLFESGLTYFAISKGFQALKPIDSYNDYCVDAEKRGNSNYIPGPGGVTTAVTNLWDNNANVSGPAGRVWDNTVANVKTRLG